jgi:hypothetical protein
MFQSLKDKLSSLSTFVRRELAAYKIESMCLDLQMKGNYIDDLGVSCSDGRGIVEAWERFDHRFPKAS